ncbi:hypothetical protein CKALI_11510 [Corynebacterium kalinowskii]|uniref:Uncharacterized protein n=1 Tax=Corynebacterium kalinowskii TaxID=2675216 RepID=A0A6B8VWR1_9CORY|nr:hypothetical protein [Corynebacterium kalinowskii]QGU03146.1 hypothetical protein CKALI_11510 [Corynebacterium kalinowskii]
MGLSSPQANERPRDAFQVGNFDPFSEMSKLAERAGHHRSMVGFARTQAEKIHGDAQAAAWRMKTAELKKSPAYDLLDNLVELGFSWRHIAQLVGVSVPAVRKWRKGQSISPDSRQKLAALNAALDIIQNTHYVTEVASWFEMPVVDSAPITPIDLYVSQRTDLIFDYANGQEDPEDILTKFNPQWREEFASDFVVTMESDGNYSIRPKG